MAHKRSSDLVDSLLAADPREAAELADGDPAEVREVAIADQILAELKEVTCEPQASRIRELCHELKAIHGV